METADEIRVKMVKEYATKNKYLFVAADFGMPIDKVYIDKTEFKGKRPPTLIEITVRDVTND